MMESPNYYLGMQKLGTRKVRLYFFLFLLTITSIHLNASGIHIVSSHPIAISIVQVLLFHLGYLSIYLTGFSNPVLPEYPTLLPYIFLTVRARMNLLSLKWTMYLSSVENTFQLLIMDFRMFKILSMVYKAFYELTSACISTQISFCLQNEIPHCPTHWTLCSSLSVISGLLNALNLLPKRYNILLNRFSPSLRQDLLHSAFGACYLINNTWFLNWI